MTLTKWVRQADIDEGPKPGRSTCETGELRDVRRRIRLLQQENEVLRRAAAYLSLANLPRKGLPARERAPRRRDPGRGDVPGTQARPPALTAAGGPTPSPTPNSSRRIGPTHCSTPTTMIPSSATAIWSSRPATPVSRWRSGRRGGAAPGTSCGACSARNAARTASRTRLQQCETMEVGPWLTGFGGSGLSGLTWSTSVRVGPHR